MARPGAWRRAARRGAAHFARGARAPSPVGDNRPPPTEAEGPATLSWDEFERRLTAALARLEDGSFLILSAPAGDGGPGYYVQFARYRTPDGSAEQLRAEAVGNEHLAPAAVLSPGQVRRLGRLGWQRPSRGGHARNYTRTWPVPVPAGEVAQLAVATLRDVYGVEGPDRLHYAYRTFERRDAGDPGLGIPPESRPAGEPRVRPRLRRGVAELRPTVERALRRWLGLEELVRDADGDYPVRVGSALLFVRLADGVPPVVRIFSPIVQAVPHSPALLPALNAVNSRVRFGRVFWAEGTVHLVGELPAAGITAEQVATACIELANIADHLDDLFRGRFGGVVMFEAPPGRPN